MKRALAAALWLTASTAAAQQVERSLEGMGRVALQGGYRWTPNGSFVNAAENNGHPLVGSMPGGPQFSASLGYAPLSWIEATIDVFVGFENFRLDGFDSFMSTSYGALLGARIGKMDFPIRGLLPYIGAQVGPSLTFVTSKSIANSEQLNTGVSINAGVTFRLTDKWGLGFDARYLFSSGNVPGIGTINGGGLWISLSVTYFIGAGPKDPMGGML